MESTQKVSGKLNHSWNGSFKPKIQALLQERDRRESKGFTELFQHHEKLFENWATIRAENLRLSMQVERGLTDRGGGGGYSDEKEKLLEQKVLGLQEELTELHRKRGENASHVLALSAKLTDREAELDLNRNACAAAVAKAADLEDQVSLLQTRLHELEATMDVLQDEHQALHLAYGSLEDKHRKLGLENSELLQRYIEVKAKHADIMNQENENFVKKKQAQVRKELEEAAAEMKVVVSPSSSPPKNMSVPSHIAVMTDACIVPTIPEYKFEAHEGEVTTVRWSPNGKHIATAGIDRKVKIWENGMSGIDLRQTLTGSNGSILCLDFDTPGTHILAACSDFACRVWTVDDGRLRHTLTGHSAKANSARFMGDASRVVSSGNDRTLKVWDLRSRACVSTKFAGSTCNDIVSLAAGTSFISGHLDKTIRFWDARSDSPRPTQEISLPDKITSLDLSVDQNFLLASVRDDTIEVLDLRMNSVIGQYGAEGFKISSDLSRASFSPDTQFIACGSADGSIFVWSVMENKLDSILKEHTAAVGAVHWHPKGSSIVSGDKMKRVVVWTP